MLTDLYVIDKTNGRIHRIGDEQHDSLHTVDGQVHYYNLQNGDGGGVKSEDGYGYCILYSDSGMLTDEYGVIDGRFEDEIERYLKGVNDEYYTLGV